jgi:hypothetical protein
MNEDEPTLNREHWNCSPQELERELNSFIDEFGSFSPEHFVQIKFHLLRFSGLSRESRDEFCRVSIHSKHCPRCDALYVAKECLLWYGLFDIITPHLVSRAPPCIRLAYEKKSIKLVTDYLRAANLIDPPFHKKRRAPSCKMMKRWGYCREDEYCQAMETEYTLEYIKARERVKQSRDL